MSSLALSSSADLASNPGSCVLASTTGTAPPCTFSSTPCRASASRSRRTVMSETLSLRVSSLTRTPPRRRTSSRIRARRCSARRFWLSLTAGAGPSASPSPRRTAVSRGLLILARRPSRTREHRRGDSRESPCGRAVNPGILVTRLLRGPRTDQILPSRERVTEVPPATPDHRARQRRPPRWNCWSTASAAPPRRTCSAIPARSGSPATTTAAVFRRTDDADAETHPERYRGRTRPRGLRAGPTSPPATAPAPCGCCCCRSWSSTSPTGCAPRARGRPRTVRLYGLLVRLVALSLTVLLVAAACEVALDLTAWQCAGSARCAGDSSWLGFLSAARRRLVVASPAAASRSRRCVPAALTGLLWYLSNRTWSAYESQRPPNVDDDRTALGRRRGRSSRRRSRPALGRPGFWYGRRLVARLRAAHTAAGLLTVAAAVAGAAARHDRGAGGPAARSRAAGCWRRPSPSARARRGLGRVPPRPQREPASTTGLDRAVVTLPARRRPRPARPRPCCTPCWSRPGWASRRHASPATSPSGSSPSPRARSWSPSPSPPSSCTAARADPRTALHGLGGPAVAMLACALGGVMSGGVAQRVADWLDGTGTPGMAGGPIPGPPVLLTWQASVIPVAAPRAARARSAASAVRDLAAPPGDLAAAVRRGLPGDGPDAGPHPPDRRHPRAVAASPTPRPLARRHRLRAPPCCSAPGPSPAPGSAARCPGEAFDGAHPLRRGRRRDRAGARLLADRPRLHPVRHLGPPRLPGRRPPGAPSASSGTSAPSGRAPPTPSHRPATPSAPSPT